MRALTITLICWLTLSLNLAQASALDLVCELGKRLSVRGNPAEDSMIELRWLGQSYRLMRVATSTGAHRFEDADSGLVWISIPSKAMLLDSKRGEPVANECKARPANSTGRPVR